MKHLKLDEVTTHKILAITDSDTTNKRIARYAAWLSAQAKRNMSSNTLAEMKEYVESAGKTVLLGKHKIEIFAPFRPEHSALRTFTKWQVALLIGFFFAWELGLHFFQQGMLLVTTAAITSIYLGHLLLNIVLSLYIFRRSTEEQIDTEVITALRYADWPRYTILCPLYREAKVVPQFARAMQDLDYPPEKLQILFLTEEDDAETRNAIRALSLPAHFKIVTVPDGSPRTKPRACNFGLMQATGQYVVIYDAEDIPEALQLKKAVLTFANHGPKLACVQAKLNFYNPYQNLLTRWFTAEYSLWFDLILPGLQHAGLSIPLGGTSNHFPTQILRALGGWDAFNVTEDCDLGLRLARYHLETVVLNSTTYEEANSQFKNWIRQRSRWIKGYMQTYLVNMRRPLRYLRAQRFGEFLSLQLMIGGKTAFLFLNPLLWILFALYIFARPLVGEAYHTLFPKPLLYTGTITLIFGNFFYIYVYLLACIRRKQYRLIKWTLLVPIYWAMMSIAAFMALIQLIVSPHYWEKTEHGLHLSKAKGKNNDYLLSQQMIEEPDDPAEVLTHRIPTPTLETVKEQSQVSSITLSLRSISTLPIPAFSRSERVALKQPKRGFMKDFWLLATLIIACIASIGSCWYFFQQHDLLLYGDAYSHMMLARRFFDSTSPGFAQLGGVWLPLPHLLMLPFIWNDTLWRSGLAGSFVSMGCYIVASIYLFLSARRLTKNDRASFVGTLVFALNPNILYLQSTPLSELACIATTTMTCYYFLSWIQDRQAKQLVWTAASIFLATLARYDGWALFLVVLALIPLVGWFKRQRWIQIEGNLLIFGSFGGLGIALWILWNKLIFGDPLYFQKGPYSAQGQAINIATDHTYHNLLEAIRYYLFDAIEVFGPILFVLALIGFVIFVLHQRKPTPSTLHNSNGKAAKAVARSKWLQPETFALLAFLFPIGFYVLSLYNGQTGLFVPGAVPASDPRQLFNARFGSEMVVPAALFLAILGGWLMQAFARHWALIGHVLLTTAIIVQTVLIARGGIITLQDGQFGGSCAFPHPINAYLAEHYTGGRILEDTFTSNIDGTDAGVELRDIIYEGSNGLWNKALKNPGLVVDWIIMDPTNPRDIVAQHLNVKSLSFIEQFTLVFQEHYGLRLYHRNGLPPLPVHPISPGLQNLLDQHNLCKTSGSA